jgi:hypothetical protein
VGISSTPPECARPRAMPLGFHPPQRANPKGWKRVAGGRQAFEATSGKSFNLPYTLKRCQTVSPSMESRAQPSVCEENEAVNRGSRCSTPGYSLPTLRVVAAQILVVLLVLGRGKAKKRK